MCMIFDYVFKTYIMRTHYVTLPFYKAVEKMNSFYDEDSLRCRGDVLLSYIIRHYTNVPIHHYPPMQAYTLHRIMQETIREDSEHYNRLVAFKYIFKGRVFMKDIIAADIKPCPFNEKL